MVSSKMLPEQLRRIDEMVFQLDVTGNVPLYGQEACCWCGAASAQMIMNGYPNPADRVFHPQGPPTVPPGLPNCWDVIQANNSTDPADVAVPWCTDPRGLRECLRTLNPPPTGTWNIFMDANRDTVMFDILYWMNRNNYPVATLINSGGHWVVIVGYRTDVQPLAGSTPTLQQITVYNPEPHNVGAQRTMTGAVWFATDFAGPVALAGSWHNQYVAVIEPPIAKGRVRVMEIKRIGESIISPREAVTTTRKSIDELELAKNPPYTILRKSGIINLQPILVREEIRPGLEEEKVPYYYIVPFGFKRETGECGVPLARLCVIINAYTGQFEEITAFGKPIRYLPEREAIEVVAKALDLKKEETDKMLADKIIKTAMMFQPSEITHIRAYPFWKITMKERVLYVDQLGKLYDTIQPARPGD